MVDYNLAAKNAKALLKRYGRTLQFVRFNETPADTNKPWNGPGQNGQTIVNIQGIAIDPIGQRQLGSRVTVDDLITENATLFLVANDGNDLSVFSEVIDGNEKFGIVLIDTLKPGEIPLISYVWVKR